MPIARPANHPSTFDVENDLVFFAAQEQIEHRILDDPTALLPCDDRVWRGEKWMLHRQILGSGKKRLEQPRPNPNLPAGHADLLHLSLRHSDQVRLPR